METHLSSFPPTPSRPHPPTASQLPTPRPQLPPRDHLPLSRHPDDDDDILAAYLAALVRVRALETRKKALEGEIAGMVGSGDLGL
ncbi:hypothetical protein Tdes44962_MAKER09568 [Teratosphaeria destructans]|uniref:Uncharacterized protein n=1 Tax=Teratosphaeria destructans TaxID=418781 RepID=A0A9W7SSN4_9PEZI|nr:hypothetical protein Tdes44962_MAKER09568 [Teratosphaeria destructans]